MKTLKIGNLELKNNIFLAPMAGVSDLPFRLLCHEQGCGLAFTEMVSAKAIYFNNQKTGDLIQIEEDEGLVGVQLFGSEARLMGEMAKRIDNPRIALFDINMGCPVPKIVNNKEGSALMKQPKLAGEIIREMVSHVDKPVTVKIRKGFDQDHVNAVEIAQIAEANGAAAITVHGRTREQYYSGKADWEIIRDVKRAVSIPVIGNGDVFSPVDAKRLFDETGCDGIMVGRGAQGNPWIFKEILHFLEKGSLADKPLREEIIETILRHGKKIVEVKGEHIGIREMRKHVSWYTKGMDNGARMRKAINEIDNLEDFEYQIRQIL